VADFIQNPRRFPRITAKYRVVVSHAGAGWSAETFDLSATGCQIVTPRPLNVGETARLVIESPHAPQPLSVLGTVAWAVAHGRPRAGIAYAARQPDGDPAAWFKRVVAAQPGIEATMRRLPERLPVDTKLFLRPPPQFIFDFGSDEVALLKMLGDGMTIASILRSGPFSAAQAARAIFALLEQRVITLSLGEAAPAWRWKAALADFEAQPADRKPPPDPPPRPPPPPEVARAAAAPVAAPPPPPAPAQSAPPAAPQEAPPAPPAAPAPPPTIRSPEAQECFDLAVSAVSMGEISTAIGLLRRGLQLSPRDPEISALLGQLAFRDRRMGEQ
jgi:Tfp pilus assembly protein PilZ